MEMLPPPPVQDREPEGASPTGVHDSPGGLVVSEPVPTRRSRDRLSALRNLLFQLLPVVVVLFLVCASGNIPQFPGWKGTLMGVATATVDAMVTNFGCRYADIVVAVGPSVGVCCFTLDREQAADFISIHPDCVPDPESAKPHVDILLANRVLLQQRGVLPEHIHDNTETTRPPVTPCTSCNPDDFFSHVRDGVNFGTQVGFLWIKESGEQASAPESQTARQGGP